MNIAVALVAGSAAVLSLVAVSQSSHTGQAEQEAVAARAEAGKAISEANEIRLQVVPLLGALSAKDPEAFQHDAGRRLVINVGEPPRTIRLDELLATVAGELELPLHVHWNRLEEYGLKVQHEVRLRGGDLDVDSLFRRINESLADIVAPLDYRLDRGVMEVAERAFFDRRELTLVTYDIGPLLVAGQDRFAQSRAEIISELLETLHQFVSNQDWTAMGGDLASETVVGDRLFVEAPPRMHRQIEWILEQLRVESKPRNVRADPEAAAARVVVVYPLRHTSSTETLKELRSSEALQRVDLRAFTADERTNAIIGAAAASEHTQVQRTLATIDRKESK